MREQELDQAAKEQRWLFLELSSADLAEAHASAGDVDTAMLYALHFYNTQKREGFSFSPSLGYPTLLGVARSMLDAGGYIGGNLASGEAQWYATEEAAREDHSRRNVSSAADLALSIAKQVKDDNKGNILQLHAQKLISEISSLPGVVVDPDLLFDAAQGQYYDEAYPEAIEGFKRLLATIADEDAATKTLYGPKVLWWIGRSFQRMERPLEAALAFREGVTTWQGDPQYDAQNASDFYRMIEQVRSRAPEAQAYTALFREAENLAARYNTGDKNDILFDQAERLRKEQKYEEAIAKYKEIEPGSDTYERGLVGIAESTLRLGQAAEAEDLFRQYVEEYVPDPKNSVEDSPIKQARRNEAMAKAEFYRGYIAFKHAEANPSEEAWQRVIDLVADYHEKYPDQTSLAPWCMSMATQAYLALGDTDKARAHNAKLAELFSDSQWTAITAVRFYNTLKEQKGAAEKAGNTELAMELELEMAKLLELGHEMSSPANFDNLRAESRHWMVLSNWEKAEPILRKLTTFEDKAEDIARYVKPDLAHALLAMRRTGEALEVLEPLVADDAEPQPSKETVIAYCRAVTGWLEPEGNRMQVIPGAGTEPAQYDKVIQLYDKLDELPDSWTCEWLAYKFMIPYAYHVWATGEGGPKDSSRRDSARNQLQLLTSEIATTFDLVDERCAEAGPEVHAVHGPGSLRAKFRWLWERVQ